VPDHASTTGRPPGGAFLYSIVLTVFNYERKPCAILGGNYPIENGCGIGGEEDFIRSVAIEVGNNVQFGVHVDAAMSSAVGMSKDDPAFDGVRNVHERNQAPSAPVSDKTEKVHFALVFGI
jgi:hypothetical protein